MTNKNHVFWNLLRFLGMTQNNFLQGVLKIKISNTSIFKEYVYLYMHQEIKYLYFYSISVHESIYRFFVLVLMSIYLKWNVRLCVTFIWVEYTQVQFTFTTCLRVSWNTPLVNYYFVSTPHPFLYPPRAHHMNF